ncbi:MAG: sigma-70 family RNA polymerase sigma factor [Planctomycetes bacterium]|nr:sigma-70 family RNA polymerase sigma factor [Planctomycetota bacterium]
MFGTSTQPERPTGNRDSEYSESAEDERLDPMREAIARLPEGHREVLELRLVEVLSYAEIAESLALPIGTVRSRIHHAVMRLRNELTGQSKTEGGNTEHEEQRHVVG